MAPTNDVAESDRYLLLHSTRTAKTSGQNEQLRTAPLISFKAKSAAKGIEFPQYAFLGCEVPRTFKDNGGSGGSSGSSSATSKIFQTPDPILLNTNTPWSAFVCGSQGSGKSYTVSCMLENCLYPSARIGRLPKPLAGIVFHNDTRSSGSICEAAYLSSLGIKVNVLVSRSNLRALRTIYEKAAGGPHATSNLTVHPLVLQSHHLNTERMHRLMAFSEQEGAVPLYMEVIMRILRDMATNDDRFSYKKFHQLLSRESFTPGQKAMMDLRLNLLESFLDMASINASGGSGSGGGRRRGHMPAPYYDDDNNDVFRPQPGTLTIVDLSDPFVDSATTCVLFDICLGIFEQARPEAGMVVALDEAHKYMGANSSGAADNFTEHLLTTIREQRHNATRVIIATQEPTISPRLLDLCSVTFVHRFSSPDWLLTLKNHLAAASPLASPGSSTTTTNTTTNAEAGNKHLAVLFEEIISLDAGESLVFSPSAVLDPGHDHDHGNNHGPGKLGARYIRFKTRLRLGKDGGRSILAIRTARAGDGCDDGGNARLSSSSSPSSDSDPDLDPDSASPASSSSSSTLLVG